MTAQVPLVGGDELGPPSLVELALERIRADILRGTLAPGERLVEEQLTRRFGVSRAPVREALRLLAQQGLVEHLPRRGVRVVELSARDIQELFDLRDALERFAVETAFAGGRRPERSALRDLEAATARIEEAAHDVDDPALEERAAVDRAAAHRAFHLAFVGLAGHRHLLRVYEPVVLQLQVYMATNMRREAEQRSPADGARRHRLLADAVATGDADHVLAALARHGARDYLSPELASEDAG
ncbi:GntR family transcriptional regulator [Actinomycetospora straminea]|uniref:GntR family transcriptional regulator n=1 Tax=Actinomycetospora straminea TaxID=663607 RepID=A0ABP9EP70_9PSEU|nr:GntR family transcriptional regulator [Actinomycetospora straminea]MDD7933525.1 GntR family transcriptional regulator [Actinomycetospora straminea]